MVRLKFKSVLLITVANFASVLVVINVYGQLRRPGDPNQDRYFCFNFFVPEYSEMVSGKRPCLIKFLSTLSVDNVPIECRDKFWPRFRFSKGCEIQPLYNVTEELKINSILTEIQRSLMDHRIPLLLGGKTLLDSYQHHGRLLFDSDYVFHIPEAHSDTAAAIMNDLASRREQNDLDVVIGKGANFSLTIKMKKGGKRDVVLHFYSIWETEDQMVSPGLRGMLWKDFYPLAKRPLDGNLFFGPKNVESYLKAYYRNTKPSKCYFRNFDLPRNVCKTDIICEQIVRFVPYLVTFQGPSVIAEVNVLNGKIQSVFLS